MPGPIIQDVIAIDHASATYNRVGRSAELAANRTNKANASTAKSSSSALKSFEKNNKQFLRMSKGVAVAGIAVAAVSVKMAADFQQSMTRLVTAAGESESNIKGVANGILKLAMSTGTSTGQLAKGMYIVESAGFHGAAGLNVLKAAAQGAKLENADLYEVTNAVTSLLVDYHLKASSAADVTSKLVTAVGHGKTTFQEMATALPNVAAAAQSAGITLSEVAAAIATMTMHGTAAAKAGTYLRQVIGQLEAPSAKSRKVMESLGISANHLALTLSSGSGHGLADAIVMIEQGIKQHMTPAGLVALETFKKAKDSTTAYQKVLADLPPSLRSTFGALSDMVGGVKSLQGFLQLGGENLKTFRTNTAAVGSATADAAGNVKEWARVQQNLNFKVDQLREVAQTLGIKLGTILIPALTAVANGAMKVVNWFTKNQAIAKALGIEVVALTAAFIALSIAMAIAEAINPFSALALGVVAATAGVIILYNRFAVARRIINDVGNAVMLWAKLNIAAFRLVAEGARLLARGFLTYMLNPIMTVFSAILHGAAIAFSWLPGVNSKLAHARDAFDKFRSDVNRIINGIIDHKDIRVHADASQVRAMVAYIKRLMASIQDVNRTVYVSTVFNNPSSPFSSLAYKPHRAAGGPVTAGMAYTVGERGQETFIPSQSGTIVPNGGGGITINEVHVHGVQSTSQLVQALQKYAKRNGSLKLSGVTG